MRSQRVASFVPVPVGPATIQYAAARNLKTRQWSNVLTVWFHVSCVGLQEDQVPEEGNCLVFNASTKKCKGVELYY